MAMDPVTGQPKPRGNYQSLTPEDIPRDDVVARVTRAEREHARLYGVLCACTQCECRVRHRFGETCVLCRDGDHWYGLGPILDTIAARVKARAGEEN